MGHVHAIPATPHKGGSWPTVKIPLMTIFVNGKQIRVRRPQLIEGMPVDEFIARNADPIWLHENGIWELMTDDDANYL